MAPEQVRGEAIDARTDIYALGVVLFEMGDRQAAIRRTRTPAGSPTRSCTLRSHLPPQLQPRLNPELERITLKCLERDPENRYQSAKEAGNRSPPAGIADDGVTSASRPHRRPGPASQSRWRSALACRRGRGRGPRSGSGHVATTRSIRPSAVADAIVSIVALPSKVVAQASDQFLTDAIPNTISAHLTQVKRPRDEGAADAASKSIGCAATSASWPTCTASARSCCRRSRPTADRLVLNVQLVDARSRRLLWSRDFEGRRDGYLALARGAAEAAPGRGQAAGCSSRPRRRRRRARKRSSPTSAGMHHFNRYNNQHEKADFDQSLAAFQRALTLDPKMADAAACIAWLYEFADRGRRAGRADCCRRCGDGVSAPSTSTIATAAPGRLWRLPNWREEGARGVPESVAAHVTGERLFDRRQELVAGSILRDEGRRTRFERALPDLGVVGGCKKDDAAVRRRGFELPAGVEAAHVGEIQVHDDDVAGPGAWPRRAAARQWSRCRRRRTRTR